MLSVSAMPKVRTQKYCSTKIHLFQSPPRLGAEVKAMAAYCRSRWKVSPGWPDWPDTDQPLVRCACAFISPPHNRNSDDKRMPHNKKQSLMILSWWTALSSSRPKRGEDCFTLSLSLSLALEWWQILVRVPHTEPIYAISLRLMGVAAANVLKQLFMPSILWNFGNASMAAGCVLSPFTRRRRRHTFFQTNKRHSNIKCFVADKWWNACHQ